MIAQNVVRTLRRCHLDPTIIELRFLPPPSLPSFSFPLISPPSTSFHVFRPLFFRVSFAVHCCHPLPTKSLCSESPPPPHHASHPTEPWITMGLRWEPKKRSVAMRQLPKDTPDRRYMTLVHSRSTTSSSTTTTTTSSSSSFLSVAVAAPPPASLLPLHFPLPLPSFVAAAPPQPLPPSLFHLLHLFLMLSSMQLLCRDKNEISAEAVDAMGKALFAYLETHNNTLHWRPVIARNSCTYGRFDDEFEELLLKHRPKVDLPLFSHISLIPVLSSLLPFSLFCV